jgi:hypothetical protein
MNCQECHDCVDAYIAKGRVSIATAQRPFGEEMSIYRRPRNVQS